MRQFVITNSRSESITLAYDPYGITSVTGLGNPDMTHQEQKAPYQDGSTYIAELMSPREIVIEGQINSGKLVTIDVCKRALLRVLNPKLGPMTVVYTNNSRSYEIDAVPELVFANKNGNDHVQTWQLTLYCHDPYWTDVSDTTVTIAKGQSVAVTISGDVESPITADITGIGYNPGLYESVQDVSMTLKKTIAQEFEFKTAWGEKSAVLKSANAFDMSGCQDYFYDACYADEYRPYVAVMHSGRVIYSIDGTSWQNSAFFTSNYPLCIAWSGTLGMWVMGGGNGYIYYSYDLKTWTSVVVGTVAFASVCWSADKQRFVATTTTGRIYRSADGIYWGIMSALAVTTAYRIVWVSALSKYFLGSTSGVHYSSDASTWTLASSDVIARDFAYASTLGYLFACTSSGSVYYSSTGTSWSTYVSLGSNALLAIGWSGSKLVTISYTGDIYYSTTGISWTQATSPIVSVSSAARVVYSSILSQFIIVTSSSAADPGAVYSSDGINWSKSLYTVSAYSVCGAVYSTSLGLWVITNTPIAYSTDGKNWTDTSTNVVLYSVCWSADKALFVGVGASGIIYYSTTGTSWTQATSPVSTTLWKVIWAPGLSLFVAVGEAGVILTSPDGTTWTSQTSGKGSTILIRDVAWAPTLSRLVAICQSGAPIYSSNAISWSAIGSTDYYGRAIAWSPLLALFVMFYNSNSLGTCAYSSDGITWNGSSSASSVTAGVNSVYWSAQQSIFYAVGASGVILTSTDGKTWTSVTSGLPTADSLYCVAYSSALDQWVIGGSVLLYSSGNADTNALPYLSSDSTFFSLQPGNNVLSITQGGGVFSATIKYRNRYIGV